MKTAESSLNRQKTLWVKEKLLVTSNFFFPHSFFKRSVSQGRQKVSLCGNGFILYHSTYLEYCELEAFAEDTNKWGWSESILLDSVEYIMGKGENASYHHFSPPTLFSKGLFFRVFFKVV